MNKNHTMDIIEKKNIANNLGSGTKYENFK